MAYEKKKYPFNWRAFAWQLEGPMVQGCKYPPKGSFTPTGPDAKNPGIYFNGNYQHESMEKPFSQALSFDNFRLFLNIVRAIANAPGEEMIVKQIAFKFFKDGEFKHSGTSVGIVRDAEGLIYFAFKNKKIPTIRFPFMPHGSMEVLDKDGQPENARELAKISALTWVERNLMMLDDSIKGAIELDAAPAASTSGGNGGGYNSGGQSAAPASAAATVDFDDDVPF